MNALQRTGGALKTISLDPQHGPRLEDEEGTKALARAKDGITHGLRQPTLGAVYGRQQGGEHGFGSGRRRREPAGCVGRHSKLAGSEAMPPPGLTTIFSTFSRACSRRPSQCALRWAPRS